MNQKYGIKNVQTDWIFFKFFNFIFSNEAIINIKEKDEKRQKYSKNNLLYKNTKKRNIKSEEKRDKNEKTKKLENGHK